MNVRACATHSNETHTKVCVRVTCNITCATRCDHTCKLNLHTDIITYNDTLLFCLLEPSAIKNTLDFVDASKSRENS